MCMAEPEFTDADMDAVSDNPELTEQQLSDMVPFEQVFPQYTRHLRAGGDPFQAA